MLIEEIIFKNNIVKEYSQKVASLLARITSITVVKNLSFLKNQILTNYEGDYGSIGCLGIIG